MECPKCQFDNPDGMQFCGKCGGKLGEEVQSESPTAIPKLEDVHARLQRSLPKSLAEQIQSDAGHADGENRILSILFADVSGSVAIAENMAPEDAADLISECLKTMVDIILKYGGTINRFLGDSVLAFLGIPETHENDPERAISAALEIREAVTELNLIISIGINTGMVYVGAIGPDSHREFTAMGTAANLASRLQGEAEPGQVLVGETTYRPTRRAFEFNPLPSMTIRGISEPVSAYEVVKAFPRSDKIRGIEGLKAPMIGRDEEFAKLRGCLEELVIGRGQIISIIGVAGVGKSRLVREMKAERQDEICWLEGRCLSIGESVSYWAFTDILKSYFQFGPGDDERAMAEKITVAVEDLLPQQADEILPLFGNLLSLKFSNELDDRLKFAGPEQVKHQTFMALRDFFTTLAQRQPLVLILEDLHWADSLSLDLISLLMEMLTLAPMMLVCVYRPEQDHKSWRTGSIASSKCLDRYTEINLRELRPQESRRMVEELLRIDNLPEKVKELILTKSEGNPFFVEEVVRSLIDNEIVYREGEIWKAKAEIESFVVPDTIQSVIMSRIDRLEDEVKYVLRCAAVIGRLFRHRLLAYTTEQERELDQHLWRLADRDLIYEARAVPELEYSFKHVLTQETAYQSVLARRRQAFHAKVADGIETLYQERIEEFYEELAYHYDESGNAEKTAEYLLLAGEKARKAYLNDQAIHYFQRVLERLDDSPLGETWKEWRLEALKGLGQIYHGIGEETAAEKYLRQAIALGKEIGLIVRELIQIYHWLGEVLWWQSRYDEVICLGKEGLILLGDNTESLEAVLMKDCIALAYANKGDDEIYIEFAHQNAQLIQHLPYSEELRPAYAHILEVYILDDRDVEKALKWLKIFEQKAQKNHHLTALGNVYSWLGDVAFSRGDLDEAISQHQRGLDIYTKIGDAKHEGMWLLFLVRVFLSLGNVQKAEEYIYRGLKAAENVGHKRDTGQFCVMAGEVLLCQGAPEKAADAFQKALELYREIGFMGIVGPTRPLGQAYLAQGRRQEALRQFQKDLTTNRAATLSGLEEAYDNHEEFRDFCRHFQKEHPEVKDRSLIQWYLEPDKAFDFPKKLIHDEFAESLSSDWIWHDPFDDCSFTVGDGLEIHAVNGRDLWEINLSAPRILRSISGDFAAQMVCAPISEEKPAIGGILLWKEKENYLRLDRGTRGRYEINFSGCIENEDLIIGRGRLPAESVSLRLERQGSRVNALCSADGLEWFTVGHVDFPMEDPVEVGLHAIGNIDRTILPTVDGVEAIRQYLHYLA